MTLVTSPPGIDWPIGSNGKTTQAAKDVWAAAAIAGGEGTVAAAVQSEKNWRFGYTKHVCNVNQLLSTNKCAEICKAGLNELLTTFVFREKDGATKTLAEIMDVPVVTRGLRFSTKIEEGTGSLPEEITVPYNGCELSGLSLTTQLDCWSEYGTCEKDVKSKIVNTIKKVADGDLKGKYFVILGAGSELGPVKSLLQWGANVLAVRTRKASQWKALEDFARTTPGRLFIPVSDGVSGADILVEPLHIRDWIASVVPDSVQDITVGMYTYLDSEAHVRVSLGCDLIMEGLRKHWAATKNVRLAYLPTPSCSCAITCEAYASIATNRAKAPLWIRMTGCEQPYTSDIDGIQMFHGLFEAQGPNYALAKSLQMWRALTTPSISYNVAPVCRTESVTHSDTMRHLLNAMHVLPPNEVFSPQTASVIMSLLLANDVLNEEEDWTHPLERTKYGAFHGGSFRTGYNIEGSKIVGGGMFLYGKMIGDPQ